MRLFKKKKPDNQPEPAEPEKKKPDNQPEPAEPEKKEPDNQPEPKKKNKKKKVAFYELIGIGKEKEYFIENLAFLLSSGMDVITALDAIQAEMRTSGMRKMIDLTKDEINNGLAIWDALEKTKLLKPHIISLVRAGEESGQLPENLKVIVTQQKKDRIFRSKLRSAMMYPALVMGLTVFIGLGIAWFILPNLTNVFSQFKMELPLITRMLIATGNFLGEYGNIAIPAVLLGLTTALYFLFAYSKTKFIGQWIFCTLPGVKSLIQQVELARFGHILGTLLKAGLPVDQALNSVAQATTYNRYSRLYHFLYKNVKEGKSLQECFASYPKMNKYIPRPMQQIIISGEKSGNFADALVEMGKLFEEKTEITTKNLTVIMEPILLIIIWLAVSGVALAVIMPIYSLVGGFTAN